MQEPRKEIKKQGSFRNVFVWGNSSVLGGGGRLIWGVVNYSREKRMFIGGMPPSPPAKLLDWIESVLMTHDCHSTIVVNNHSQN